MIANFPRLHSASKLVRPSDAGERREQQFGRVNRELSEFDIAFEPQLFLGIAFEMEPLGEMTARRLDRQTGAELDFDQRRGKIDEIDIGVPVGLVKIQNLLRKRQPSGGLELHRRMVFFYLAVNFEMQRRAGRFRRRARQQILHELAQPLAAHALDRDIGLA